MMQNQGMTSKTAIKVPKRQDLRAEGKKIKSAFNIDENQSTKDP